MNLLEQEKNSLKQFSPLFVKEFENQLLKSRKNKYTFEKI